MALQGTLESFAVSEIFQLIYQQGKTGTLFIEGDDGQARVRFLEGKMVEAWADRRSPSEFIGAMLVRARLISHAQLDHALETQRQSLRPLGDILIRMGALRVAEFQEMLALQHRETIYKLLQRKRGRFSFANEPVELEEGISVPTDVGALLMEGFRQIDEWPALREAIPTESRIFAQTGESEGEFSREEMLVLGVVDGASTVREVVDQARLGDFTGWETLTKLLQRGAIAQAEGARKASAVPVRRPAASTPATVDAVVAALLLLVGTVVVWSTESGSSFGAVVRGWQVARREAAAVSEQISDWNLRRPSSLPPGLRGR